MPTVSFSYAAKPFAYPHKKALKKFIDFIFVSKGKSLQSVRYIFCTDDYLLNINRQFLQHDYFTDIITFNLSENNNLIGEIYISIDRVRDNAGTLNLSFENELIRVVFHGALHLCGYKDKTKSEIKQMRNQEAYYIRLYMQSITQP